MDRNFLFLVLKNWSFFMLLLLGKINFAMIEDTSTAFLLLPYSAFPSSTLLLLVLSLSWWSPIDSKDSCISYSATVSKKKKSCSATSIVTEKFMGLFWFWVLLLLGCKIRLCAVCIYSCVGKPHWTRDFFLFFWIWLTNTLTNRLW